MEKIEEVGDVLDAAIKIMGWSFEQQHFLIELLKAPDTEGSVLCKKAGCSWDEMAELAINSRFIILGMERLHPQQIHPQLTAFGEKIAERLAKNYEVEIPNAG